MKKLFIAIFLITLSQWVLAQSTTPRFGTAPNQDYTGRNLQYMYATATDATGVDTAKIYPRAFETFYNVTMTDSLMFRIISTDQSYFGDQIIITATGANGNKLKFFDANFFVVGSTGAVFAPSAAATPTPSITGGTLAAGTYYYKITATNANGETTPNAEVFTTIASGTTGSVALTWPASAGATGYRIYRGTAAGQETAYQTSASASFTDAGGAGTNATPPVVNNTTTAFTLSLGSGGKAVIVFQFDGLRWVQKSISTL